MFDEAIPSQGIRASTDLCGKSCPEFRTVQWTDSSVKFPEDVRLDGWVKDGTEVTPFYDPLLAKILAHGKTETKDPKTSDSSFLEIHGIETNIEYLNDWVEKHWCRMEPIYTRSLETFTFIPRTIEVLRPGTQTTVQDYPGRLQYWDVGIPPSGPMDNLSFRLGNLLVGNEERATGLEITGLGPRLKFNQFCVIAVCGAPVRYLNDKPLDFWQAQLAPGDLPDMGQVRPWNEILFDGFRRTGHSLLSREPVHFYTREIRWTEGHYKQATY